MRTRGVWQSRFECRAAYRALLERTFRGCAAVMRDGATVYVRTDARPFTYETTLAALREAFPGKPVRTVARPFTRETQTALFGDKAQKPGEIDLILEPA